MRAIWWTAVVFGACFGGMALWLATAYGDPMSILLGLLAAAVMVVGYGALSGVKRRGVQASPSPRPAAAEPQPEKPEGR